MRKTTTWILILVLTMALVLTPNRAHASAAITTPATGYDSADDVQYITVENIVVNWGARGEDCTFLTTYAQAYYTNHYTWNELSTFTGGTGTSDAPSSDLYRALQDMMTRKQTHQTSYGETRYQYCYTDCVQNDYTHISSFYSGKELSGTWDSGATWNREHTWPNSKGMNGSDEDDIMMLRPTWKSENSSRGNTAYGESSGYFDPGPGVRGDCARIVLYVYVRWGNTKMMWGTSGVMENLDVLLKWMEEDPVDTWEMGRNDSVESITGVRNVFVDYPEYAWLLFGQEVPEDLVTPSSGDSNCTHENVEYRNQADATCSTEGHTGDVYCADCGAFVAGGSVIPANNEHTYGAWEVTKMPTETEKGSQRRECTACGYEQIADIAAVVDGNTTTGPGNSSLVLPDATTPDDAEKSEKNTGNALVIVGIVVASVAVVGAAIAIPTIILSKKKAK